MKTELAILLHSEPYSWGDNALITNRIESFDDNQDEIKSRILEKWETEPEYVDIHVGRYHLVIWRHPEFGQLNGYVGVKRGHPCYGKDTSNTMIYSLSVHWGITFADERVGGGFKKGFWYFGFDTAHAFDYAPLLQKTMKEMEDMDHPFIKQLNELMKPISNLIPITPTKNFYKDIQFVSDEVQSLHSQLSNIQKKNPNFKHSHRKEYKEKHKQKLRARRIWGSAT